MSHKSSVRDRLAHLEELRGILPTRAQPSETLSGMAEGLRANDIGRAASAARTQLDSLDLDTGRKAVAPELYEDPAMREQMAGFAGAGMNFFHSDADFWNLPLAERANQGGNGLVNRVFVHSQRLLLETSRIALRFETDVSEADRAAIFARHNITRLSSAGLPPDTYRADTGDARALDTCLMLMEEAEVTFAEPDFIEHIGQRLTPNDPDLTRQWHHANILSRNAWDRTQGEGIRVAVIDNGFDTTHPDLIFGAGSGHYRPTFDFVDADFIPGTANIPDGNHGTACAGMIAAIADNNLGGCGVAPGADLRMIACMNDQVGTQLTLARAIAYAADPSKEGVQEEGADIIACSLGPNGAVWTMSAVLSDALDFAAASGRGDKGCAIFWACTNGNHPIGSDQVCSHAEVMAVGRATANDTDNGSGFGPKLDFLAPGVKVWIPASGGTYHETTGTSFAAPCAAGIGALALSQKPDMTAHELRQVLRDTCDKVGPLPYIGGHNIRYGHGRANAEAAVAEARRRGTGL
ncbi:Subtilisin-like serine protease (plasmid) [Marinovum algicola DG 898]|nr:Subtilisin-like serine protease [Marinovum algicola DG 898]